MAIELSVTQRGSGPTSFSISRRRTGVGAARKKEVLLRGLVFPIVSVIVIAVLVRVQFDEGRVPPGRGPSTKSTGKKHKALPADYSRFPRCLALKHGGVKRLKLNETEQRRGGEKSKGESHVDAFPKPPKAAASKAHNATTTTCEPYATWSKDLHPICNGFHDLSLQRNIVDATSTRLLGSGASSLAWSVYPYGRKEEEAVLRTQRYDRDIKTPAFQSQHTDAIILDRLASSPYVMDIYGHCGLSTLNEYASGMLRGYLDKHGRTLSPEQKLALASDAASGIADLHSIDGNERVTVMHRDVSLNNFAVLSTREGPRLKLHDFNTARFRTTCGFGNAGFGFSTKCDGKWKRAPEDCASDASTNASMASVEYPREKMDTYILGTILFYMLCGEHPYSFEVDRKPPDEEYLVTHLAQKDYPTNAEGAQIVQWLRERRAPSFPADVESDTNVATMALVKAIRQAMHPDIYQRPNMALISKGMVKAKRKMAKGRSE